MKTIDKDLLIIDNQRVKFYIEDINGLCYKNLDQKKNYSNVAVRRLFPLTDQESYIRVISLEDGQERAIICSLDNLDKDSATIIKQQLELFYFIPSIIKINSITDNMGTNKWEVETEQGASIFEIKDKTNIRFLSEESIESGPGVFITDIDGNRYEIKDINQLDKKSIRLLEMSL